MAFADFEVLYLPFCSLYKQMLTEDELNKIIEVILDRTETGDYSFWFFVILNNQSYTFLAFSSYIFLKYYISLFH